MATFATTAAPNNATAAEFRAWAKAFHDAITTTGGWIQTADTGQINFATVAAPGAANTKMGYAVYRMNDSLQATNPIFMKVAFGSASLANYPGIWFGIGTATDGAGNLIDPADANRAAMLVDQYSQTTPAMPWGANSATLFRIFASVGTDRFTIMMFERDYPTLTYNSGLGSWVDTSPDYSGVAISYSMLFSRSGSR